MFSRNVDIEYRCSLGSEGDWFQDPHRYQDRWRVKYFMYLLVICAQLSLAWCHIWIKYLALNDVNAMEKGLHIQGRWCVLNMFGLSPTLLTWNLCRKGCRRPAEDISTLTNNQHWGEVAGPSSLLEFLAKKRRNCLGRVGLSLLQPKTDQWGERAKDRLHEVHVLKVLLGNWVTVPLNGICRTLREYFTRERHWKKIKRKECSWLKLT